MSRLQTEHLSMGFEDAFFVYTFVIVYVICVYAWMMRLQTTKLRLIFYVYMCFFMCVMVCACMIKSVQAPVGSNMPSFKGVCVYVICVCCMAKHVRRLVFCVCACVSVCVRVCAHHG